MQRAFDRTLDALGPFEAAPALAAGVSGGADSMALALLADAWASARGGALTALIVDHGLRKGSAAEARQTKAWLDARGVAAEILTLPPLPRRGNRQAAAREARYAALAGWCRDSGVLHLLVAHHRRDQAETVLMRLARGSGVDGLAAMPAVQNFAACRLLRPLLAFPPDDLRRFLRATGQVWSEDPSNRDPVYRRVRVRRALAAMPDGDAFAARLARSAGEIGQARAEIQRAVDRLMVRAVRLYPEGYAHLDLGALGGATDDERLRVLARLVRSIGGAAHAPRFARLAALHAALGAGERLSRTPKGRTLGGCRLLPEAGGARWLVCRETAKIVDDPTLGRLGAGRWDGRFAVADLPVDGAPARLRVRPLGAEGWRQSVARAPWLRQTRLPYPARLSLPALWRGGTVVAAPHLGYRRDAPDGPAAPAVAFRFRPRRALGEPAFRPADMSEFEVGVAPGEG